MSRESLLPFGRWVKQLRAAIDLTQEQLAARVNCSVETIRKVESGERRPSRQIAELLAQALELAPDQHTTFLHAARLHPDHGQPSRPPAQAAEPQTARPAAAPASPATLLPVSFTPFVGRESELAELAQRLADPSSRLITLVGPGGIGKTRLALQAAAAHQTLFAQGAAFVALAPVGAPDLLIPAIAHALGCAFSGTNDPRAQLIRYLRDRELLLLLDNFEHVLNGVDLLSDILAQAPGVKLLVTSRERLLLQQEWVVELQGLTVPDSDQRSALAHSSAIALFVDRARRVQSGFALAAAESASVARICRLVEGLPLGIELAAAWVRILSCAEIVQEIERSLDFLAASARDLPERHRSLRAVFAQSWNLLADQERQALRRLSVFRGDFSREAAEAVAAELKLEPDALRRSNPPFSMLNLLAALVDKSLLRSRPNGRYDMHELIRQYASEQLQLADEGALTHERHARYYLALAEAAEPHLRGAGQAIWRNRLELEHDNLRAALAWSLADTATESDAGQTTPDELAGKTRSRHEIALRLAGALWRFWELHSHFSEGRQWIERALEYRADVAAPVRAKALCGIGVMTEAQGVLERSVALLEESLALRRQIGDQAGIAESLLYLGRRARNQGDYQRAIRLEEESLGLFRAQAAAWGIAWALLSLGDAELDKGAGQATARFQEALDLGQAVDDKHTSAWALCNLGRLAQRDGDDAQAIAHYQASLALFREIGSQWGRAEVLYELGRLAQHDGDAAQAIACYQESLVLLRELEGMRLISGCLEGLASLAGVRGQTARAARLFGAAAALRASFGPPLTPAHRADHERAVNAIRVGVDDAAWMTDWSVGQTLPLEQVIHEALKIENEKTSSFGFAIFPFEANDSGGVEN